jgi:hypothetical protein
MGNDADAAKIKSRAIYGNYLFRTISFTVDDHFHME